MTRAELAGLAAAGAWVAVVDRAGVVTHGREADWPGALARCVAAAVAGGPWRRVEG